jgi:hypothetical protein
MCHASPFTVIPRAARRELPMRFLFFAFFFAAVSAVSFARETTSYLIHPSIPAGVWVTLPPLQLRTHHIGEAPGPAGASPHLPTLPAGAAEASDRVGFV